MPTDATEAVTAPAIHPPDDPPLRRNRRFQLLWAGSACSLLGSRLADTAYPLLLLTMTGSPALAGAFGAVQFATSVAFGLHGGAVADRRDRRRVLLAADGVRCLAAVSSVVALALRHFSVPQALLVAAVIGAATAYGGPVRTLAVRAVVPTSQLRQALAQDELRGNAAALAGPPLAGLLLALGRVVPFLGTAIGSLLSFTAVCAVRYDGRPTPAGARTARSDSAWAGFRPLRESPLLRATLGAAVVLNLVGAAMTLTVMVLLRDRGGSTAGIGLTLAGEAVGAIAGTFLVGHLHRLAGPGRLLLAAAWLCVPLMLAPLLPGGPVVVFLALAAMNLAMPALRVMVDVLIFQQVPDAVRGRVIAVTMTTVMLGLPAGTMGSGLLLDRVAPGTALAVLAGLLALGLLPSTLSRALRTAAWPS
ncbi:MFS transporter [Kitasatospora nipponensis]|uniref:MFS transporter n=1 Tax=Kitasatospora nipponensis TaxID=258049 RepID=A0ABN1WT58_9ACTN